MLRMTIDPSVMPPPPWRWRSVRLRPAGGDAEPTSRGLVLVAEDGTVLALAGDYLRLPDLDPGVLELLARAGALEQVPELTELWTRFREATTPVTTADATLQFANAFYHFTTDVSGELEEFDDQQDIVGVDLGELEHPTAKLTYFVARLVRELEEAKRHAKATAVFEPLERAHASATLIRDLVAGQPESQ